MPEEKELSRTEKKQILRRDSYNMYMNYISKEGDFYQLVRAAFLIRCSEWMEVKTVSRKEFLRLSGVTPRNFREIKELLIGCQVIRENLGRGNQHNTQTATIHCYPVASWDKYLRLAFEDHCLNDIWLSHLEEIDYEVNE